jgi:phosphopantothenoylcysteine decarboxylase/phosphopantothenate--cysteine ligase, prokaryotic
VGYAHLKDITGSHGDELAGKRIALCVTASASIYRAPETARLLMRHGADVIPVMTREAASLLSPEVMRWATGNDPVVEVTGRIEYVELTEGRGRVDAVVVAPMTENAAAKVVGGIADDAVSLLVSCALGSGIPVVVAPAMHASMYSSPVVRDLMARLRSLGIVVVGPTVEEGKAKLAQPEDVLDAVIYATWPKPLSGRRYVVTAGPTRERIDMVRFVTNPSSGRMGLELARVLRALGGDVTIVHGPVSLRPPWDVKAVGVESAREMLAAVLGALEGADGLFAAAAVADYEPAEVHSGKIESRRHPTLQLTLGPRRRSSRRSGGRSRGSTWSSSRPPTGQSRTRVRSSRSTLLWIPCSWRSTTSRGRESGSERRRTSWSSSRDRASSGSSDLRGSRGSRGIWCSSTSRRRGEVVERWPASRSSCSSRAEVGGDGAR